MLFRSAKGRVFSSWFTGGPKEPSPENIVLLCYSDDQAKSFTQPQVMAEPKNGTRCFDPTLWIDPKGRLWYVFNRGNKDTAVHDVHARICDDPDATPPVFGAEFRVGYEGPYAFRMNKPTVLSTGEWIMPVTHATEPVHDWFAGPKQLQGVGISTDEGKTWKLHGALKAPEWALECMITELKDGRLWLLTRTGGGFLWESHSSDKGRTWTEAKASTIPNPGSRFFIRRLASGKLILVKNGPINARLPRRSNLKAFLSDDDGKTWGKGFLIDDRAEVSYPDGFQAPNGDIHILYDWNRHTDAEILHVKFTEADIAKQAEIGKLTMDPEEIKRRATVGKTVVNKAHAPKLPKSITPDPTWAAQAIEDAKQDFKSIPYDGITPNKMVCDTTLRELPDGSWILFILAGGDTEPSPLNYTGVTRSHDMGKTWTPLETFDVGFPREGKTIGQGPTELMILGQRSTLFFSTHSKHWANDWRSWYLTSDDSFKTWSKPIEVPGRLKERTFIRKHIVCKDGRLMAPFQHYIGPESEQDKAPLDRAFTNPRNGVLISSDGGKTWTEHGNIRLTPNSRYFGWAENDLFEHPDGRITMVIRGDGLGGMLYKAESKDGGKTWPEFASITQIPNPGSKTTLYNLGGDRVAILHNPNSKHRSPMALWISFDGMKTWPYQRVLQQESVDGPKGRMNYPDGFVSKDGQWLHFAFDDNRHRAVHYSAKLPPLPAP